MPGGALAKERLAFLDVARGLAALMVLAEHGLDSCLPGFLESALGRGNLGRAGVVLFLLISGFIIPASLEQGGSNARFWLRRFFRLFPAYWLSIAIAYGYCCWTNPPGPVMAVDKTSDWLLNLTMLQGFFGRPHVWGVFWTLQLELVLYATCSLLFAVGLLRWSGWLTVLAVAVIAVMGLGKPLLEGQPFAVGGPRFLLFAPLVGLAAQRFWVGKAGRGQWLALLFGPPLLTLALWSVSHALYPEQMTRTCLEELAATWGIACICFFLLLGVSRWPMPPVGCWLGRISYSFYLLHPFVLLAVLPSDCPDWAFLPALLTSTLVLAELSYRFVELPGIALGRAVERRLWAITAKKTSEAAPMRRAA